MILTIRSPLIMTCWCCCGRVFLFFLFSSFNPFLTDCPIYDIISCANGHLVCFISSKVGRHVSPCKVANVLTDFYYTHFSVRVNTFSHVFVYFRCFSYNSPHCQVWYSQILRKIKKPRKCLFYKGFGVFKVKKKRHIISLNNDLAK